MELKIQKLNSKRKSSILRGFLTFLCYSDLPSCVLRFEEIGQVTGCQYLLVLFPVFNFFAIIQNHKKSSNFAILMNFEKICMNLVDMKHRMTYPETIKNMNLSFKFPKLKICEQKKFPHKIQISVKFTQNYAARDYYLIYFS